MAPTPNVIPRAFVAGWPVAHSLSPILHGHWLKRYRIDGSYEAVPVEPGRIAEFLAGLADSGYCGGNITIPHKEAAFAVAARLTPAATAIGAVNTVWLESGILRGDNTDAYGFSANLDAQAPQWRNRTGRSLILGAGGAARAIVFALRQTGFDDIVIVNRTRERAGTLAEEFGAPCRVADWDNAAALLRDADLLVNTTSLGMTGQPLLSLALDDAPAHLVVADIVYMPLETDLLVDARARGLTAVDGLGMLLHQAVPGFERWFKKKPVVDETLRAVMLEAAAKRHKDHRG